MVLMIIGVVLNGISATICAWLSWVIRLCKGSTVRKLAIVFGILFTKSIFVIVILVLAIHGKIVLKDANLLIVLGSPLLEVVGFSPFGYGMLRQVRQANDGKE